MIDRITIYWIIIMFVSAILGLTCNFIFGVDVIYTVIVLMKFWVFCCLFEFFIFYLKKCLEKDKS